MRRRQHQEGAGECAGSSGCTVPDSDESASNLRCSPQDASIRNMNDSVVREDHGQYDGSDRHVKQPPAAIRVIALGGNWNRLRATLVPGMKVHPRAAHRCRAGGGEPPEAGVVVANWWRRGRVELPVQERVARMYYRLSRTPIFLPVPHPPTESGQASQLIFPRFRQQSTRGTTAFRRSFLTRRGGARVNAQPI